jgi:hypothetical protein
MYERKAKQEKREKGVEGRGQAGRRHGQAGHPTCGRDKAPKKAVREDGKMSGLDAAAKVLAEATAPMNTKTIAERAVAQGYWKTGGKTPQATLHAAISREIKTRGTEARFKKTDRGLFAANA